MIGNLVVGLVYLVLAFLYGRKAKAAVKKAVGSVNPEFRALIAARRSHPLDCEAYANPPSQTWPILLGFAASQ